jgi:hypothetical protein
MDCFSETLFVNPVALRKIADITQAGLSFSVVTEGIFEDFSTADLIKLRAC